MILTKSDYISNINILLKDNSTQLISPLDVRTSLTDLVDSVHLFTDGVDILSANFATPDTRTTRAGVLALGKLQYTGRSSVDNSAFGYYALGANYDGGYNTAIGSHSMGCNMQGTYNTALGYASVSANTIGSGNLGLGAFSLQAVKTGSFNIAIGYGAGAHIPTGDSYKFYVGVDTHIDSGYCLDPTASGRNPLMYGDLQTRRLAIGIANLHNYGALQVSGDVSPSHDGYFNIGNEEASWNSINETIYFSGDKIGIGTSSPSGDYGFITIHGDVVPSESGKYKLGHPNLTWDGYFNDLTISGQLHAHDVNYNNVNECLYDCKTLHLATSGLCDADGDGHPHNDGVCGYLTDESLDGAGFITHSSGNDYQRNYRFLYRFPDSDIKCIEYADTEYNNHYARSRWESNISIEVESGCHFQGNRLLGDQSLSVLTQSGCYGLFFKPYHRHGGPSGDRTYIANEPQVDFDWPTAQDVNFIARSGTHRDYADAPPSGYNYTVMYGTVDSGVQIAHEFSSRIKTTAKKRGFSIVYHDELDT